MSKVRWTDIEDFSGDDTEGALGRRVKVALERFEVLPVSQMLGFIRRALALDYEVQDRPVFSFLVQKTVLLEGASRVEASLELLAAAKANLFLDGEV